MLKELAAREPPSSLPQLEIQPGVPNLLPQRPNSCPPGQPQADLSLLESPGVPPRQQPHGSWQTPKVSAPRSPCELPLSTPRQPVPVSWKPFDMQRPDLSLPANSRVGRGGRDVWCVCVMCVHIGVQCYYTHASVCTGLWLCSVASFLLFQSLKRWGWASSLPPSLPHPAPTILGYLHLPNTGNRFLSVHPSLSLGSSRHPSAPSPSYLRNRPGSRKAMTVQQLVGGRENPGKPDSTHQLHQLSFWRTQTLPVGPRAGPSHPQPLVMCPPC